MNTMNERSSSTAAARILRRRSKKLLIHAILAAGGLILIYPLIFSVLAGFFSTYEFATRSQDALFPWPQKPTLENFSILFTRNRASLFNLTEAGLTEAERTRIRISVINLLIADHMPRILLNSVIRVVYTTFLAILTSLIGGYAFGRIKWKGRDRWFMALLATQMLPAILSFIPQFLLLYRWPLAGGNDLFGRGGHGLFNTMGVYFYTFCAINIMGTFLVRQAFQRIPLEYDEAAHMDGAGTLRILFTILTPLQKPVLAYIAISTAIGTWNDWIVPYFFTSGDELLTVPGAISRMTSLFSYMQDTPNYPLIITLGLAVTIPSLIILAFFQKYIVEGLSNTGVKG